MNQPRRKRGLLFLCGLSLLGCTGCTHDDADRLARVWRHVGGRIGSLTGDARRKLFSGWSAIQERTASPDALQERVAGRLKLDKGLANSGIEVEVDGSKVTLRGKPADATARTRAVELARATLGVEEVIDELTPKE